MTTKEYRRKRAFEQVRERCARTEREKPVSAADFEKPEPEWDYLIPNEYFSRGAENAPAAASARGRRPRPERVVPTPCPYTEEEIFEFTVGAARRAGVCA
ncbi:MAG: hypothetical protein LBN00_03785 [Oscillospiraceae bacterium]|jgi:hypothetical protein|nr:hypothetical protein [Oscillospiraceae bacterium]